MANTPETNFKNKVIKYLKDKGIWHVKYFANMFTKSGIPDILGVLPNGKFFALELKVEPNKPTPLQIRNVELINKTHGKAYILYPKDFEQFKRDIESEVSKWNSQQLKQN